MHGGAWSKRACQLHHVTKSRPWTLGSTLNSGIMPCWTQTPDLPKPRPRAPLSVQGCNAPCWTGITLLLIRVQKNTPKTLAGKLDKTPKLKHDEHCSSIHPSSTCKCCLIKESCRMDIHTWSGFCKCICFAHIVVWATEWCWHWCSCNLSAQNTGGFKQNCSQSKAATAKWLLHFNSWGIH